MTEIRMVYIDYGNVLSLAQSVHCRSEMQRLSGLSAAAFEEQYSRSRPSYDAGHIPAKEYWYRILGSIAEKTEPAVIGELIHLDLLSWAAEDSGMVDWAVRVKKSGRNVGILSNMPVEMDYYLTSEKEWYSLLDPRIISGYLKVLKPEPEIYSYASAKAGHRPEEILFIDDMEVNINAAAAHGFRVYRYSGIGGLSEYLRTETDLPLP